MTAETDNLISDIRTSISIALSIVSEIPDHPLYETIREHCGKIVGAIDKSREPLPETANGYGPIVAFCAECGIELFVGKSWDKKPELRHVHNGAHEFHTRPDREVMELGLFQ